MTNIHAAIEIGTTRTVLAVGESDGGGPLRVICHAEIPSTGVRKSQILDIGEATQSIRGVLQKSERLQAAEGTELTIGDAVLVVSGQHVEAEAHQCTAQIDNRRVSEEDVREVMESARSLDLPKHRELMEIIEQDYAIDALGGILDPKGMAGGVLKLSALYVHADRNRIQDARTAAEAARLEITDPVFAATCAANAVLDDHERKNGVLVLDLGGGSTGYAAYADGYLVTTGVIGVGGDHVSNDIAHAFQTTHAQAEELKIENASATLRKIEDSEARVKVQGSSSLMEVRTVSRRALDTVVNARYREIMSIIREKLAAADLLTRLHAGVVLTGGGAGMLNLGALIHRELGLSVRIGAPVHVSGLEDVKDPASFAAIAGALIYARENSDDRSLLRSIFGGLFQ